MASCSGAQGCLNDWLIQEAVKEARASECRQGSSNCLLRLIVASIKSQGNGARLRLDLGEPMVSVKAIGSERLGRCAGQIDVLGEVKNRDVWLCCGLNYLGFILAGKAPQDSLLRWQMVPGIGGRS